MVQEPHYSTVFNQIDPDGDMQVTAEELIAAQLSENYEANTQLEHAHWIIQYVSETFCPEDFVLPVAATLDLFCSVYDYLGHWQNGLQEPNDRPDEGEAGQAGKDLLLLVLQALRPEYVIVDRTAETEGVTSEADTASCPHGAEAKGSRASRSPGRNAGSLLALAARIPEDFWLRYTSLLLPLRPHGDPGCPRRRRAGYGGLALPQR